MDLKLVPRVPFYLLSTFVNRKTPKPNTLIISKIDHQDQMSDHMETKTTQVRVISTEEADPDPLMKTTAEDLEVAVACTVAEEVAIKVVE